MGFKILISDEAKSDIEQSIIYYKENVSKKVAVNFLKDYRKTLNLISESPFFRIWYDDFRAIPMKKYPFIIFYLVDFAEKTILISRVFHTSQNPEKYP